MSKHRFTSPPAAPAADRRLIVVSNREPYRRIDEEDDAIAWKRTTGGLVSALDPVMRRSGGTWIAWKPGSRGGITRSRVPAGEPSFTLLQVPLSSEEVERYHEGFANRALWPLCHYFVDRCRFDEEEWRVYERINERFADAVAGEARGGELVWIHDYHFCLLPRLARKRGVEAPIAFFLHVPFPAPEIFQIFPWHPYAVHEVADALHEALTMSPEEQARRMRTARRHAHEQDVARWLDSVLQAAARGVETWAA